MELISYVEMYMACICEIKLLGVKKHLLANTLSLIVQWIPRIKCFQELLILCVVCL